MKGAFAGGDPGVHTGGRGEGAKLGRTDRAVIGRFHDDGGGGPGPDEGVHEPARPGDGGEQAVFQASQPIDVVRERFDPDDDVGVREEIGRPGAQVPSRKDGARSPRLVRVEREDGAGRARRRELEGTVEHEHVRSRAERTGELDRLGPGRRDDDARPSRERVRTDERLVADLLDRIVRADDPRAAGTCTIRVTDEDDVRAPRGERARDRDGDTRLARAAERRSAHGDGPDAVGDARRPRDARRGEPRRHVREQLGRDPLRAPVVERPGDGGSQHARMIQGGRGEGAPDRMSARAFFDAIARRYDRDYALSGPVSRARLARVVGELSGRRRVLVLGIGTGRELPALLDAGHEPVGIDVSPEMIAKCNERARTVPIVEADFYERLPFEDASFDAAIALHGTLAHPPRDGALADLARELARVLVPGGVLVAEVPAAEGLARLGVARTPSGGFVHRDEASGIAIEGVALTAGEWLHALSPYLDARIEPLGDVEHLVVATRR